MELAFVPYLMVGIAAPFAVMLFLILVLWIEDKLTGR